MTISGEGTGRDRTTAAETLDRRRRRTKEELLAALADFDAEAILSLVRPGRLGEWKAKLFELRVAFEEADRGR